jgi:acyl dehydratase
MIEVDVRTLADHVGKELAVSNWQLVSQTMIEQFAETTDDRQWIHVDAARAAVESPFRTTIAHGFLTLSLLSSLLRQAVRFTGSRMAVNYGLNRVRFVSPVPSGARVRGRFAPGSVSDAGESIQVAWHVTVEQEGGGKPCCVAEWIVRYYPA